MRNIMATFVSGNTDRDTITKNHRSGYSVYIFWFYDCLSVLLFCSLCNIVAYRFSKTSEWYYQRKWIQDVDADCVQRRKKKRGHRLCVLRVTCLYILLVSHHTTNKRHRIFDYKSFFIFFERRWILLMGHIHPN